MGLFIFEANFLKLKTEDKRIVLICFIEIFSNVAQTQLKEAIKPSSINVELLKEVASNFFLWYFKNEIPQLVHPEEFAQPSEMTALLNTFFTFY